MKKINLLLAGLLFILHALGNDFLVYTSKELAAANSLAKPGDQIILKKGEWKNITIQLTCRGTLKNPIIVKPEIEGKTIITGNSMIKLGGSFITVRGFQFINGF
ncbi:MAG: TonB-dependent receptor, partial [Chitinophagaceae bacterium]|nr:TonB-dependent receptor [Chitinophagaceae bacterium]